MKKLLLFTLVSLLSFFAFSSQKAKNVAVVKLVRGKATMLSPDGELKRIKKGDWIKEGTIIKTKARSFVKLSFIDKSNMNVGPRSELKIEKFSKSEAGVINILTGKIRAQVTKDYLKMDKNKSKLFVKSRNAVMGVRGTDFLFSVNKKNGSATTVLFEGSVVFNKIHKGDNLRDLESIVNKGRRIRPGEVSVATRQQNKPTVSAKMSSRQFKKLDMNKDFVSSINPKNVKEVKSIVPPGLSGAVVASDNQQLKDEIKKIIKIKIKDKVKNDIKVDSKDSMGFVRGDDVKPADGSFVHIDSGTIIPPGADSSFDSNTNEWVSSTNGVSSTSGEYVPPKGFKINDEGQLLKVDVNTGAIKGVVVIEIKPVDQMKPITKLKMIAYIPPTATNTTKGPSPAGGKDSQGGAISPPTNFINGGCSSGDSSCLKPPPICRDCGIRPPSLLNNFRNFAPPPSGKTRVNIKVNRVK